MKILAFTFIISFFGFNLFAQKTIAVIQYSPGKEFPLTNSFIDSIHYYLKTYTGIQYLTYDLKDSLLRFLPEKSSVAVEQVADYVMFYTVDLFEDYKPPIKIDYVEGNVSQVYFRLSPRVHLTCKIIDIATNTIAYSNISNQKDVLPGGTSATSNAQMGVFPIPNYRELFGLNLISMEKYQPEQYNAILAKLHKDFNSRFSRFIAAKKQAVLDNFFAFQRNFLVPGPIPISDIWIENEKAKKIWIDLPPSIMTTHVDYMRVFSLDTVNGFVFPDLHGFYYIQENDHGKVKLDAGLYAGSKNAGLDYLAGKKIYASFDEGGYFKKLNDTSEIYTIGLNNGMSINTFENSIMQIHKFILIDLGTVKIMDLFRNKYKQEIFMVGDFESKNTGAKYLLETKDDKVNVIDVEKGLLVRSYDASIGFAGFVDESLEIFNLEVEIIEISKGDEERIKKLRLYSPIGFDGIETFKIYELTTEKVNGADKVRPVVIAHCQAVAVHPSLVKEFVITKGEKELYNALHRGAPIRFRQRTFTLFGKTYY